MTWRTNPVIIFFRKTGKQLGINRIIQELLYGKRGYEEQFGKAILGSIRPGNIVWDVGANVGFYTRQFAQAVGSKGMVYAFEPSPENVKLLTEQMKSHNNIIIVQEALGSKNTKAFLKQSSGDLGVTSRIITPGENPQNETIYEVEVQTGDRFVELAKSPVPNLVKIDTEGAEGEILEGMGHILSDRNLRTLFIEVHFSILQEKGTPNVPKKIEEILVSKGFELQWIDLSHLAAQRKL